MAAIEQAYFLFLAAFYTRDNADNLIVIFIPYKTGDRGLFNSDTVNLSVNIFSPLFFICNLLTFLLLQQQLVIFE